MEEEGESGKLVKWRHFALKTITTKKGLEREEVTIGLQGDNLE